MISIICFDNTQATFRILSQEFRTWNRALLTNPSFQTYLLFQVLVATYVGLNNNGIFQPFSFILRSKKTKLVKLKHQQTMTERTSKTLLPWHFLSGACFVACKHAVQWHAFHQKHVNKTQHNIQLPLFFVFPLEYGAAEMLSPPEKQHYLLSASFNNGNFNNNSWICIEQQIHSHWLLTESLHNALYAKGHMTHTFLLAPPSDTLGLVLKSPSKLNIVRFFPLTDSGVTTNTLKEKVKVRKNRLASHCGINSALRHEKKRNNSNLTLQFTFYQFNRFFHNKSKLVCLLRINSQIQSAIKVRLGRSWTLRHTTNFR